jgi:hypothetical protein
MPQIAGFAMHETLFLPGLDSLLFDIPAIALLFAGLFRLDELILKPAGSSRRGPAMRGVDERGDPIVSDPDGRVQCRK